MNLTLDSLKEMGAFSGAPIQKEITWTQYGEEHKAAVYVRRLSYDAAMSDINSIDSKSNMVAGRIASSIVDKDGKPVFAVGDITGEEDPERGALCYALTMELLRVIGEVSGLGEARAKSPTKTKSSAS